MGVSTDLLPPAGTTGNSPAVGYEDEEAEREQRRREVLRGGYALRRADQPPRVVLVGVGAVMPEVLAAATVLDDARIPCDVLCLTSPDLVFRAAEASRGFGDGSPEVLERLFPPDRAAVGNAGGPLRGLRARYGDYSGSCP